MYKYEDSIEKSEDEYEGFSYSYIIFDKDGQIVALTTTEEMAIIITEALNAGLQPHEKE